jgi:hypothetical protein
MWIIFIAVFYALPFIYVYREIRRDCINEGTTVGFTEVAFVVVPFINIIVLCLLLVENTKKSNLPNKFFRLKK